MIHKLIIVLVCAVLSSIFYRFGGIGKPFASWNRDWVCPAFALFAFYALGLHAGAWYKVIFVYVCTYGMMGGALSTYHDYLAGGKKNSLTWFVTGLFYGLACLPFIFIGVAWWLIVARAIILGLATMAWSDHINDATTEELGRGMLFVL